MPTKTFINLNPVKQELIFNALLKEFAQHKLLDAQVARIIKDCGIARGSFYKYFADLTDSYNYTLKRVLDEVHFDVFNMIKAEKMNTLDSFYQATADFINQISDSKYRDFYRMHVAYNQYNLKSKPFNYHELAPEQLIMIVNGERVTDHNKVAVVYKTATAASHNAIRSILLGADQQVELSDLKTLLQIMNQGLLEGVH
ncbi:TetR/AcrR family transcriptional regulator [Lactobacillus sp. Sy-1]|uniref:TetR/AcrR family transcriptional regulator n=1 Tax=Lactobacillus sp. Sy-1 TaxID=2109645 RepID=UPI001C57F30C|nr:TetR/AcrR family transcriptional regulator [Lactobacillus sp. Sy-1]MBW1604858.1 TetR/AcrR family transcriptional regulator [Lactobacillus sp. Sy-1]